MLEKYEAMLRKCQRMLGKGKSKPKKWNCDKKLKSIIVSKDATKDIKNVPSLRTSLLATLVFAIPIWSWCIGVWEHVILSTKGLYKFYTSLIYITHASWVDDILVCLLLN